MTSLLALRSYMAVVEIQNFELEPHVSYKRVTRRARLGVSKTCNKRAIYTQSGSQPRNIRRELNQLFTLGRGYSSYSPALGTRG
jgi:hypothetical protein